MPPSSGPAPSSVAEHSRTAALDDWSEGTSSLASSSPSAETAQEAWRATPTRTRRVMAPLRDRVAVWVEPARWQPVQTAEATTQLSETNAEAAPRFVGAAGLIRESHRAHRDARFQVPFAATGGQREGVCLNDGGHGGGVTPIWRQQVVDGACVRSRRPAARRWPLSTIGLTAWTPRPGRPVSRQDRQPDGTSQRWRRRLVDCVRRCRHGSFRVSI